MPVIRGRSTVVLLTPDRRESLLEQLRNELGERSTAGGPLVFEIPLEQSDRIDVLVVWQEWENIRSGDRTNIILEAYVDRQVNIAQALGVTYSEAMDQHLLPYAVQPMIRPGEADPALVRQTMLEEGAIALPGGKVELRFPSMAMAEEAHRRLCSKLPQGFWSIVQTMDPIG